MGHTALCWEACDATCHATKSDTSHPPNKTSLEATCGKDARNSSLLFLNPKVFISEVVHCTCRKNMVPHVSEQKMRG